MDLVANHIFLQHDFLREVALNRFNKQITSFQPVLLDTDALAKDLVKNCDATNPNPKWFYAGVLSYNVLNLQKYEANFPGPNSHYGLVTILQNKVQDVLFDGIQDFFAGFDPVQAWAQQLKQTNHIFDRIAHKLADDTATFYEPFTEDTVVDITTFTDDWAPNHLVISSKQSIITFHGYKCRLT